MDNFQEKNFDSQSNCPFKNPILQSRGFRIIGKINIYIGVKKRLNQHIMVTDDIICSFSVM